MAVHNFNFCIFPSSLWPSYSCSSFILKQLPAKLDFITFKNFSFFLWVSTLMCGWLTSYWSKKWNWGAEFKFPSNILNSLSYKNLEKIMNPSPPSYWLNSNLDSLVLDGCCFKVSSEFKIMEITIGNFSGSFSKKSWKHTKKCQPRQIMFNMKLEIKQRCITEFISFP